MILAAVLSLTVLGQVSLPGSPLSLEQAEAEARFIVVAEVGKTADRFVLAERSFLAWTELKPSAVLKGGVTGDELSKHPLVITALWAQSERLPETGDELVFFIGDGRDDFFISKILPRTDANLAAIKAAMLAPRVKKAEKSHGLDGSMSASNRPFFKPVPPPSYKGTKINPDPKATGEMLKLQEEFAAAMSRADPDPEGRRAHFAWLGKNEYFRRYGVLRIGWYGGVRGCEHRTDGGWTVKVAIQPWLHCMSLRFNFVNDTVEETYEFIGGRIRLIESDATVAKPSLQHFPVAF